jgi:Undecaprenyl-phosphate galactose phosphotransferase WbaP
VQSEQAAPGWRVLRDSLIEQFGILGRTCKGVEDLIGNTNVHIVPAQRLAGHSGRDPSLPQKREKARRQWLVVLTLLLSDVLLAGLLWGLAVVLYGALGQGPLLAGTALLAYVATNTVVWVGMRALLSLYPGYGLNSAEELRRQTLATVAALAVVLVLAFGAQAGEQLSRLLVALNFAGCLLLTPLVRHLAKRAMAKAGLWGKPVVVLGAGEAGRQLVRTLKEEWGLGFDPSCVFDFPLTSRERAFHNVLEFPLASGGRVSEGVPRGESRGESVVDALRRTERQGVDTVIFAMPHVRREDLVGYAEVGRRCFEHVVVIPNLGGVTTSAVTARDLGGVCGVEIKHNLLDPWALRAKRTLDLVLTVIGGIFVLPLLGAISVVVWVSSPEDGVFYKAQRMGKDGKLFSCLKFRTMAPDAEDKLRRMLEEDPKAREEYLTYHKLREDPRVTRVGRILRKTSLDELPQLVNVLKGEMSLVGPRPYLPRESEKVGDAQEEVLRVPPGMTGPWQVGGRSRTTFEERVRMEDYYVRGWSVWLDLVLLARTAGVVLFDREAA